ncbi:MAG TPA: Sec-independent protein translocase protein TatB [Xanthobacteraceae bacterium]|nr:Sec-independent protein translocase protein TatB [Xanthobacteraceae bacterium]
MFDIAWGEFVVIAVVALIVIGPKELPAVLRAIGQWTTKIRRMASEFQSQFQEALREAEMADLKKEVDNLNETAKGFTSQFDDPLNFKEATKWEPKPDDAKPDDAKPADTLPEPALVTPDGYAAETTAGGMTAAEAAPVAVEHSASEQVAASPATPPATQTAAAQQPEGSGQGGAEGSVRS